MRLSETTVVGRFWGDDIERIASEATRVRGGGGTSTCAIEGRGGWGQLGGMVHAVIRIVVQRKIVGLRRQARRPLGTAESGKTPGCLRGTWVLGGTAAVKGERVGRC